MRKILVIAICLVLLTSCSSTMSVQRLNDTSGYDLSGRWNVNDFKYVSEELITSCLSSPWEVRFRADNNNQTPVIIVGNIINNSSEHVDTAIISKQMELALLNSSSVQVAADLNLRDDLRSEKESQQFNASLDTMVEEGVEIGADYILQGSFRTSLDYLDGQSVRSYYVALELVDIETGLKCWADERVVNKYIARSKYRF